MTAILFIKNHVLRMAKEKIMNYCLNIGITELLIRREYTHDIQKHLKTCIQCL
jgi:ERCC4-related helicase